MGLIADRAPSRVVHLAAQAGVRHSIEHPFDYVDANLVGFINLLEACRLARVQHLVFASSSSVYGQSGRLPFRTDDPVSHPLSLYAATKKANELMAHAYSHLHGLAVTGLRFFTVYGPWGRPDMALFLFAEAMLRGEPIPVFNHGEIWRDFTYIDDVVQGVLRTLDHPAAPNPAFSRENPDPASSDGPYRIYNIGNAHPCRGRADHNGEPAMLDLAAAVLVLSMAGIATTLATSQSEEGNAGSFGLPLGCTRSAPSRRCGLPPSTTAAATCSSITVQAGTSPVG
jgi:nucleoside-diphosphate-sugar epimerase